MEDNIKQEKIELYLTGQLKDKDLEEFENTLETDEAFAQDVEIMRDLEEAMGDFETEKELSSKLKFLGKKYIAEKNIERAITPRVVPMYKKRWFVAATILLTVVAGGLLFQNVLQVESETDYFASYYKPYPSNLLTRGENDDTYNQIVELYNEKKFVEAIPLLKEQLIELPNDTPSKILLGNSYLGAEPAQVKEAIEIFKSLTMEDTNVYHETAKWYLALAYIKDGQQEEANKVLETLATIEYGKYPKLAKELLEQQQ